MKVFRAQDIPDAYKIAVYDALCKHFEGALDNYYTDPGPQDARYDSGGVVETTACVGMQVDVDTLYIVMQIKGWADTIGFSLELADLPTLTRDDQADEGAWIEVGDRTAAETLREKSEALASAVAAYFNKRGVDHAERKGNEDIAAMADALSDYGYAVNLADAPPAGG